MANKARQCDKCSYRTNMRDPLEFEIDTEEFSGYVDLQSFGENEPPINCRCVVPAINWNTVDVNYVDLQSFGENEPPINCRCVVPAINWNTVDVNQSDTCKTSATEWAVVTVAYTIALVIVLIELLR